MKLSDIPPETAIVEVFRDPRAAPATVQDARFLCEEPVFGKPGTIWLTRENGTGDVMGFVDRDWATSAFGSPDSFVAIDDETYCSWRIEP